MISIETSFGGLPVVSITDEPNVVIEVMGKDRRKRRTTSDAVIQLLDEAVADSRRQRAADRAQYEAGGIVEPHRFAQQAERSPLTGGS